MNRIKQDAQVRWLKRISTLLLIFLVVNFPIDGQTKISYDIHYLVDSSRVLSLENVLKDEYQHTFDSNPLKSSSFGFDKSAYWFRINLRDYDPQQTVILEVGQPSLDYITLYSRSDSGEWKADKLGHALDPTDKPLGGIDFAIPINPERAENTIYLQVQTSGTVAVPILITHMPQYGSYQLVKTLLLGLFFGLMFIMAIYNFLLYLFLKDQAYLYYVGATVFGLATSLVLNGYGYLYVWPNSPNLDAHIYLTFGSLSMVCSSRFAAIFLNLKRFDPKMDSFLWIIAGASLLTALLSLFYNATQLLFLGRVLVLVSFPSYLFIGIRSYLRGYKTAIYYIVAWLPYILGLIIVTLRGAGMMPEYWFTAYSIELGGALEAVLLSFALAARIKGMRKEIAEKELEKEQFKTKLLSEQKILLEQKVEERTRELEEVNATKDKFFSIIAHDLRSPMIALQGVGQKLEYFIRKDRQEKLLEMGAKIDQSIDQLNHLLNNLLNWAASQTGGIPYHPEQFDISEIIQENIGLYQSLSDSKKITIRTAGSSAMVYADKNTTSTIIRNLLSNAIKFSPGGSEISISTSTLEGKTTLEIKDGGQGMDELTVKQLFKQSVKTSVGSKGEKGFGLGLKLTKEFVDKNNGTIEVKSNLGSGTSFLVTFPKEGRGEVRGIA